MERGRPSRTAVVSAMMRAAHLLLDEQPPIFADTLAAGLCGFAGEAQLRAAIQSYQEEFVGTLAVEQIPDCFRQLRAGVTMRARYIEDQLERAVARGISQYVILGAGLDSLAYRRRDLRGVIQIFEVDHPATQTRKQALLRELRLQIPPQVTFVPIDFEQQDPHALAKGLGASGFDLSAPAFFSWAGVSRYLTGEAVLQTLQQVASMAAPTEIVFDYSLCESLLDADDRRLLAMIDASGVARGEPPVRSRYVPESLAEQMSQLGYSQLVDVGAPEMHHLYATGRTDWLRFPRAARVLHAQVKSG